MTSKKATPTNHAEAAPDHVQQRPRQRIRRAAVLGAGTMGTQIAALLANQGIPCDLLDMPAEPERNRLAQEARQRLLKLTPSPVYEAGVIELIHPGNFADDLPRLREADWVIEAIVERLDAKQQLWSAVAPHLRPDAIASSNTSGIPIASIAASLPESLRPRFLGTHFFNPPRYLRLLELIPTAATDPGVTALVRGFADEVLGKGTVIAHDVPNFIANRIGAFGLIATFKAMDSLGLGPDEVDSITGSPMGRPSSATFRTLDLVGIDVFLDVCDNLRSFLPEGWERDAFEPPAFLREMAKRRWIGEKAGQGFYKRVPEGGESQILTLDPKTLDYRPRKRFEAMSITAARNEEDPGKRLKMLLSIDDKASRFAWQVMAPVLLYSAVKVGEIADDIVSMDRAMRWGFGWELGPFEAWDALGLAATLPRMQSEGRESPAWVRDLAQRGASFYRRDSGQLLQANPQGAPTPVPRNPRSLSVSGLQAEGKAIARKPGASLYDLGEGVAFLDFHSPKQAIGPDMVEMLDQATRIVPRDFLGLVIGSHVQPNFCVGANLFFILMAAQEGEWEELNATIGRFQRALLAMKRFPVPVVSAPFGLTLGGGAEIALASSRVAAASETYMGLVEVGAGVIPAGGGCKEMLLRALERLPGGLGALRQSQAGPPGAAPQPDPNVPLARVFETIGQAKVATSALEARTLGFLRPADRLVPNLDQQLFVARGMARALDAEGYEPSAPVRLPVLGPSSRALLDLAVQQLVWGGYATEHDQKVARKLAHVLTGGNRPPGSWQDEEYFLDLEREAFLSLCGEPKTIARMQHVLQTGKPLRN